MTTRVRVAVRCRPLVEKERSEGCQDIVSVIDDTQVLIGKDKCFTYDYAFGTNISQEDVFQNCGYPLVEAIFKGFNATMLAYGQTGSGKTYTMGSGRISEGDEEENLGIIPRVVEHLFNLMKEKECDYQFKTSVSFLEIYNEEIKDLLSNDGTTLAIREDGHGIKIAGLTEQEVCAPTEALNLLCKGGESRVVGSTKMNEASSRSHAIFTIHIEQQSKTQEEDHWSAKFHLVDLAGSERIKKTGAEGDRRKEGININLGLLALGNVVSALGDEKKKASAHIPYRDSKLTRLLQDSLGGNSYTLMMACVSPADSNMEETINTLRYADRARKIKNKPIVNRDPHVAEILRLKALVSELQSEAVSGQLPASIDLLQSLEYRKLKERSELLEEQNSKLTTELTNAIDHSNELCEKIVLMEMSREKLQARLAKISIDTNVTVEELDRSLKDPDLKPEIRERLEKAKAIQQELSDLEKDKAGLEVTLSEIHDHSLTTITELSEDSTNTLGTVISLGSSIDTVNTHSTGHTSTHTLTPENGEEGSSDSDTAKSSVGAASDSDVFANTYTLHRAKMSRQLKELNDMLTAKETLMSECVTTEQKKESLQRQQSLEKKIKSLEDERDRLSQQLVGNKASSVAGKISEQRRQRLKELENQMSDLKRKLKEQSRIVKMKEQTDKQLEKMNKEILNMKQQRVRLMKQIKEESENFRRWKMEQDKKLMQLKARDRKRDCEMAKMELQHSKSQSFYKRKAEEAAMANKRLKEALDKQKASRDRHSKNSERDMANIGTRVKSLIGDEIDIMVSIKEAERLLADQQQQRAALTKQLKGSKTGSHSDTQSKLLQTQLNLCTASIAEFNQKLQDAKSAKSQPLSEKLTSMVETRCAIRHLTNLSVQYRLETLLCESNYNDNTHDAETNNRHISQLQQEISEMEEYHFNEMKIIKTNYERKLAALKYQLEKAGGNTSQLDINSMQLDLTSLNDELEEKNRRIEFLETKLKNASELAAQTPFKAPLTPKSGLPGERFPDLNGVGGSPFLDKVSVSAKNSKNQKLKMKTSAKRKDNKLTVEARITTVPEDESFELESSDDEDENDDPADLSWHMTPEIKRMRRMSSFSKCSCTTNCAKKLCSCRSKSRACGPLCGCTLSMCQNPETVNTTSQTLNTTFDVEPQESSDLSADSRDGQNKKVLKRQESSTSLLAGKRRKLLSTDNNMYFGSPV